MKPVSVRFYFRELSPVIILLLFLLQSQAVYPQVSINNNGSSPDSSSMLDVQSTSKGVLVPRMTGSQRTGIQSPAVVLLVFQTDTPMGYYYYKGSGWTLQDGFSVRCCR
jgi:hypothetical protein